MKKLLFVSLSVLTLMVVGCSSRPLGPYGYTDQYEHFAASRSAAVAPDLATVHAYLDLFNPLNAERLKNEGPALMAEELYFNDTMITAESRDELIKHLSATADRLESMQIDILDVVPNGDEVLAIWIMDVKFKVLGRIRHSRTLGISQLRFDEHGKLIFHQDFWDGSQGLDQHLPLIGPLTRSLRQY